jgi:hypothetical protein
VNPIQLREENAKLVADLPWTATSCRRSCKKSCKALAAARVGTMDSRGVRAQHASSVGAGENHSSDAEIPRPVGPTAGIANALVRTGSKQSAFGYRRLTVLAKARVG